MEQPRRCRSSVYPLGEQHGGGAALSSDERALVAAVVERGDERAFGTLFDRHTPALYALALRLTGGDEPEAQEIVHDAWVRAGDRFGSFEARSTLRVWLSGILVNRWRELARAGAREAGPPIEDLSLGIEDDELRGVFDRIDLERVIAALPAGYRQVFILHDIEGYTHQEIAGLLDIASGTSKSQLSCARRELRRALAPRGEQRA